MAVTPTTESGAVKGTPLDTTPTTTRINIASAVGVAGGIALVVYGVVVHQHDTVQQGIEVISGAVVGLGATATAIWGHVQAMTSEVAAVTAGTVTTTTTPGGVIRTVEEPLVNATAQTVAPVVTPAPAAPAAPAAAPPTATPPTV